MKRLLFSLAACLVVIAAASAQPSRALFAIDGRLMEYKADVESSAADIDDVFNASAVEGWRPQFVLRDAGRFRLLLARAKDVNFEPMEYKAETLHFADDIADRFREMAEGGWRPLFVFPAGLRYRLLFGREKDPAFHVDRDYRADTIDDTREVDDKFNQHAEDGWRAMFLLSATDSTEIRMLFGRERNDEKRNDENGTPQYRYISRRERSARRLDDTFNELALAGWRPIFTFPDGEGYRMLFERLRDDEGVRYEYRADLVDEARAIDDKFNQVAAEGWQPVDLFWDDTRMEFRLLFARRVADAADSSR